MTCRILNRLPPPAAFSRESMYDFDGPTDAWWIPEKSGLSRYGLRLWRADIVTILTSVPGVFGTDGTIPAILVVWMEMGSYMFWVERLMPRNSMVPWSLRQKLKRRFAGFHRSAMPSWSQTRISMSLSPR